MGCGLEIFNHLGFRPILPAPAKPDCIHVSVRKLTFTVSVLVAQYRALFDGAIRTKQLPHIVFLLLLVQHPDEQLSVVCTYTVRQRCRSIGSTLKYY